MAAAILEMTSKGFGCTGVVDETGELLGIITDGDLRRHMADGLLQQTAREVMTAEPAHHRGRGAAERGAAPDDRADAPDHRDLRHGRTPPGRHRARARLPARRPRLSVGRPHRHSGPFWFDPSARQAAAPDCRTIAAGAGGGHRGGGGSAARRRRGAGRDRRRAHPDAVAAARPRGRDDRAGRSARAPAGRWRRCGRRGGPLGWW